ncbi:MAG: ATP-binding protein [Candidatus Njordarchaeia archaeon]
MIESRNNSIEIFNVNGLWIGVIKSYMFWHLFASIRVAPQSNSMNIRALIDFVEDFSYGFLRGFKVLFILNRENYSSSVEIFLIKKSTARKGSLIRFRNDLIKFINYMELIGFKCLLPSKEVFHSIYKRLFRIEKIEGRYIELISILGKNRGVNKIINEMNQLGDYSGVSSKLKELSVSYPLSGPIVILLENKGLIYNILNSTKSEEVEKARMRLAFLFLFSKSAKNNMGDYLEKLLLLILGGKINRSRKIKKRRSLLLSLYERLWLVPKFILEKRDLVNIFLKIFQFIFVWFLDRSNVNLDTMISNNYSKGDIFVGYQLLNGSKVLPFFLNLNDLKRHMLIVGPSGKGKTSLAKIIINELLTKNLGNVWIIDFHGEYAYLKDLGFEVIVPAIKSSPIALNIFSPIYEELNTYGVFLANVILDLVRGKNKNFEFSPQMESALVSSIIKTISESPTNLRNPLGFLINLWNWVTDSKRIDVVNPSATFFGVVNRIRSFFSGAMASVLWVKSTNIDFEELIGKNIVIDLSELNRRGASKKDLILLVNVLLRFVMNLLYRRGVQRKKNMFLVLEEARYLVPWRLRESTADTTALEDFAVLARKYGLSLITISQSFSSISRDIVENVGTFFIFGVDSDLDNVPLPNFDVIRKSSILPPKQAIAVLTSESSIVHVEVADVDNVRGSIDVDFYREDKKFREQLNYEPIAISFDKVIQILGNEGDINKILEYTSTIEKVISEFGKCSCNLDKNRFIWLYQELEDRLYTLWKHEVGKSSTVEFQYLIDKIRDDPFIIIDSLKEILMELKDNDKIRCIECLLKTIFRSWSQFTSKEIKNIKWEIMDLAQNINREIEKSYNKPKHNPLYEKSSGVS